MVSLSACDSTATRSAEASSFLSMRHALLDVGHEGAKGGLQGALLAVHAQVQVDDLNVLIRHNLNICYPLIFCFDLSAPGCTCLNCAPGGVSA